MLAKGCLVVLINVNDDSSRISSSINQLAALFRTDNRQSDLILQTFKGKKVRKYCEQIFVTIWSLFTMYEKLT